MVEIAFSSSFRRAFKNRIAGDSRREQNFWKALETFKENPNSPALRTHKLSGKLKDLWSFRVEYDLRIIFYFENPARAIFVDIGTHKEVY